MSYLNVFGRRSNIQHDIADILTFHLTRVLTDCKTASFDATSLQFVQLQRLSVNLPSELLIDLDHLSVLDRIGREQLAIELRLDHELGVRPARKVHTLFSCILSSKTPNNTSIIGRFLTLNEAYYQQILLVRFGRHIGHLRLYYVFELLQIMFSYQRFYLEFV